MPDRTISLLSIVAALGVCAYVAMVIVTVSYAAVQTELALSVRDTETEIGMLESHYYDRVGTMAAMNPESMNLHKPTRVTYAVQAVAPSLSLR